MTARAGDNDETQEDPADGSGEDDRSPARKLPQDQPGQPGSPSRADSRRAAMEANQRPPGTATETRREKPSVDTTTGPANPEKSDDKETGAGERRAGATATSRSPLEDLPSYGGFDNLAEEFDARAESHARARELNAVQASDSPDGQLKDRSERRYSGELVKVDKPDADADSLAERIDGVSRVKFENDPQGREFDAVSDTYIGQAKPADFSLDKKFRMQAKASFDAAQQTGRSVYYHFDGPPDPRVVTKLNEYSERYGVDVVIDTDPFDTKA